MCATRRPFDGILWQNNIEKLAEKGFAPFNELGVDAGHIDLPHVQAGFWMDREPGEDVENACPLHILLQQHQWLARNPSAKHRETFEGSFCHLRKAFRLRTPADDGEPVAERGQ